MKSGLLEDGPLAHWPPAFVAVVTLLLGLIAYMTIGYVALVVLFGMKGISFVGAELIPEHATTFFVGNAIGLLVGMGFLAVLIARLVSTRPWSLLRARTTDWRGTGLALLGLLFLLPAVVWIGELNESVPLPEFMRVMEEEQLKMIEAALYGEGSLILNLALVALTPALFEEVFFRGLVQRNFERAWGASLGIVATGVVFGLFHLRMTQVLPLMVVGVYLAYLAWRTGSLWVPVIVHFVNNALALVSGVVARSWLDMDLSTLDASVVPWYVAVLGAVMLAGIIWTLQRRETA